MKHIEETIRVLNLLKKSETRLNVVKSFTHAIQVLERLEDGEGLKAIIISKATQSDVYNKDHNKIGSIPLLSDFEEATQALQDYLKGEK